MTDTSTTHRSGLGPRLRHRLQDDRGSATAEYAVVILAGVARKWQVS
jgi:hypothetical protein